MAIKQISSGFNSLSGFVGRMRPGSRAGAMGAAKQAMRNTPGQSTFVVGKGGAASTARINPARRLAGQQAMRAHYVSRGKVPTKLALFGGVPLAGSVAMRPNSNQTRGGYRPMGTQTAKGIGRYA